MKSVKANLATIQALSLTDKGSNQASNKECIVEN